MESPSGGERGDRTVLGVDIGGTKIAAAIVTERGQILAQARMPTPPRPDFEALAAFCRGVVGEHRPVACGLGSPGPLDVPKGLIAEPPNLPGWRNVPITTLDLSLPIFLENDANAAAVAEHRFGAGKGVDNLVYMTISTGIGGGAIVDGHLVRGANGNAVEIGHISVAYDGWDCICGSKGCIEQMCSGTMIARRAGMPTAEVVECVRRGELEELWAETMAVLGAGVASVINSFNPQLMILGGGVVEGAGELLLGPVRKIALERALKPLARVCQVVQASLPPADLGMLGAAAVAFHHLEHRR